MPGSGVMPVARIDQSQKPCSMQYLTPTSQYSSSVRRLSTFSAREASERWPSNINASLYRPSWLAMRGVSWRRKPNAQAVLERFDVGDGHGVERGGAQTRPLHRYVGPPQVIQGGDQVRP